MTREVVDALRKKEMLAVSAAKMKVWSASGLVAFQVDGCTIRSQDEVRALGLHVGAGTTSFVSGRRGKAFWPLRKVLIARSLALSVRWIRWKAGVSPVLVAAMVPRRLEDHQHQHHPGARFYGTHSQESRGAVVRLAQRFLAPLPDVVALGTVGHHDFV